MEELDPPVSLELRQQRALRAQLRRMEDNQDYLRTGVAASEELVAAMKRDYSTLLEASVRQERALDGVRFELETVRPNLEIVR